MATYATLNPSIKIVAYTVVDADVGEAFSTTSHEGYQRALDNRERLAQKYGKEHCLEVWGIDEAGKLWELTQDDSDVDGEVRGV